jgi:hypothetical protein
MHAMDTDQRIVTTLMVYFLTTACIQENRRLLQRLSKMYDARLPRKSELRGNKHGLDTDTFKFGNGRRLDPNSLYQVQHSVDVDKQSSHMFRDA